ncbi:MAG: VIT family protein [Nitrosomonas sp.]|jgi:VIT1/CCC1 family predicted Fe2+/Mn2+ transporter
MTQHEIHHLHRVGWLRAAVLGANDGIISTASLIIGIAAAQANQADILLAGCAGMVAGAMSMAAGEYVSVSSQSDTEKADIERERKSLGEDYEFELQELASIYEQRGLDYNLARKVAQQLMAHNALEAHTRDELGLYGNVKARPIQAALFSCGTFAVGAALPMFITWMVPFIYLIPLVAASSLIFMAILGGLAAYAGGASILTGAVRITFWGALAMGLTAIVGKIFGVTIG